MSNQRITNQNGTAYPVKTVGQSQLPLGIIGLTMVAMIILANLPSGTPVVRNVRLVTPGSNSSIWSHQPMLSQVPGQHYYGRVVVEIWDRGEQVFYNSGSDDASSASELFERVIFALKDPQTTSLTVTPWTDEPALGTLPGQVFRGRVVAEVWNDRVIVAATGSDSVSELFHQAIQRLETE